MGLCMCTHILDDDHQLSASQSFARDVAVLKSRIQARKLPIVWMLGAAPATHAASVADRFGFVCLDAQKILKEESGKDNSRGKLVRAKLSTGKRMPDRIMVDLMKEQMISAGDTRGYLLFGFPWTAKQAQLFTKDLTSADCVILLQHPPAQPQQPTPAVGLLSEGDQKSAGDKKNQQDKNKDNQEETVKEIVEAIGGKWDLLVEKINVGEPPADIFLKIEAAIMDRTAINKT